MAGAILPAGVEFVEGELADRAALENLFIAAKAEGKPFDGVLHFAALIEAGESMVHPEQFFRNNTASTLALLEAILAHGPRRLVFSSTAAVYGEPEVVPIKKMRACCRPTPMASPSCWSSTCSAGSTAFTACARPRCATSTWPAPRKEPERHHPRRGPRARVAPDSAGSRRRPGPPQVDSKSIGDDYPTPDGTCIRDYIHVSDLADAHLLALNALETTPAAAKPADLQPGQRPGLQRPRGHRIGPPRHRPPHPRRSPSPPPGDPAVLVASSEKAIRELGWKPRYTQLDEIVRTAWVWHQKRYAYANPAAVARVLLVSCSQDSG
jgi:UDP-glucose 4-epimerase